MKAFDGVVIDTPLSATDRGSLWRASRAAAGDRIIRKIDPRYCDAPFLKTLAALRGNPGAQIVPVTGEGWIDDAYCLEYTPPGSWQTLGEYLAPLHWRHRLYALYQVCEAVRVWEHNPVRPLGLHPASIVMIDQGGAAIPWLLACPPFATSSPLEYWDCDPGVMACLPPEVVRGVYVDYRLQDDYAVGVMAAQALGCAPAGLDLPREGLIEAQVRGKLTPPVDLDRSSVEDFLRAYAPLQDLAASIRRYTLASSLARPTSLMELKNALAAALNQTEALSLARAQLERDSDTDKIFELLEWGFQTGSDSVEARSFGSELALLMGDLDLAIHHLDGAVAFTPGSLELRRKRCDLYMVRLLSSPETAPGAPAPEGDLLLGELEWLLGASFEPSVQRELVIKTAQVYQHRQDFMQAANLLYLAVEKEPSDLNALYQYARCLARLGSLDSARQAAAVGIERAEKMAINQMISERTAKEWREKFKNI